ncbi:MAG: hypothetical protein J2P41_09330, partial [Blastocatellia bacterium]|nr:hypothetical protein [Blastocatellia bacterium]
AGETLLPGTLTGLPPSSKETSEKERVILSGIHPEAPESWRRGLSFTTPASVENAYAATLIRAALNRVRLEHY